MKNAKLNFNEDCIKAFLKLRSALVSAPVLQPPFELMCDASDYALGAVLGQPKDKKSYAIYYCRALRATLENEESDLDIG